MNILLAATLITFNTVLFAQSGSGIDKLEWLEGSWTRTNAKPGRSGYEVWERVSATEWKGTGISMRGADTTMVEKLKIIIDNGELYYVSDVPENNKPIPFRIIELTDKGFASENPKHDFPKRIEYWYDGKTLTATISGDGKSIGFVFEKK